MGSALRRAVLRPSLLIAVLVLAAIRCVAEEEGRPDATVISADGAVIPVIRHRDLFGTALPVRMVDTVAAVRVGEDDDLPLYEVAGALLLSDGTLVVADGSQQLHFISNDGSLLRTIGGEGEGPGEFQAIQRIDRMAEDSVLVHDRWSRRVTVFSRSGELGRVNRIPRVEGARYRASGVGAWADGTLVLWQGDLEPMRRAGSYRSVGRVLLFRDGDIVQVTESPGEEIFVAEPLPGQGVARASRAVISRETLLAARGNRLYLVDTATPVIHVYEFDKLVMQIRDLKELAPIPESIWADLRELGMPREIVSHSTVPFLTSILAASSDALWLLPFQGSSEDGLHEYVILDRDGGLHERVVIAGRYEVLWAEEDQVVVSSRNAVGVEVISVFRIGRA